MTISDYGKKYRLRHRDKIRNYKLNYKYKISESQYKSILKLQNGVCAVCKLPETEKRRRVLKNLCVDHDHLTGKIRGLLCQKCNRILGYFEKLINNPILMKSFKIYLAKK